MKTLTPYVVGVVIALAIAVSIVWYVGGPARARATIVFALGFLAGMLSMYIKMRILGAYPLTH